METTLEQEQAKVSEAHESILGVTSGALLDEDEMPQDPCAALCRWLTDLRVSVDQLCRLGGKNHELCVRAAHIRSADTARVAARCAC